MNEIGETIKDEVVKEILREEKNSLRAEKKRPWSPKKTKAPFYDRARYKSKINSFQAALDLAEKIVNMLGVPWKPATRGRPSIYSPSKVTSALLCKHFFDFSFERLREKLIETKYDCRKNNKKNTGNPVPCKSELHWALLKVPKDYFDEANRLIDEQAAKLHGDLFGTTELNKFAVDGTSNQCDELEEALIACKRRLRRKIDKVNVLVRLVTNTISEISSSECENQKDLRKLLEKRKNSGRSIKNIEVIADRDYDVEYNYEYAEKNGVKLTIKPKLYQGKIYKGKFRTKVQALYSSKTYRKRKKVERPFGNMFCRDGNKIHYKSPNMKEKGELLRVIAHNMKAYFMQEAWLKIFKTFSLPLKNVRGDEM
ncbi:MAG: transposase [Candidatus Helarchaeota archaeon]